MEGIFTLPYSEYEVINQFQKKLKKSEGYSVYLPVSRQQKGIDFLVHNFKKNKYLRIQVKSSRSYMNTRRFVFNLWFNNFINRYKKGVADLYVLFGLYPLYKSNYQIKARDKFWKSILLCFPDEEMGNVLKQVKTKKEKKPDRFFGIGFNSEKAVFGTRGFAENLDFTRYVLKKQVENIKNMIS